MATIDRLFLGETRELDEHARAQIPGTYIRLSDGVTRYELAGPVDGMPVVLVHGFSGPYFIWDSTFGALAAAGRRVVRYDLFGRGYSDRPALSNDKDLFDQQLNELLEALGLNLQVDIVSLSMGGVVAAEFAHRHPERVRKLVFIDPAGFDLQLPFSARLLKVPGLGEILLGVLGLFGNKRLIQSMIDDFYEPDKELLKGFVSRYEQQMKYRGFKRSLLSSYRNGLLDDDRDVYRKVGEGGKPVMLIWGERDQTVPYLYNQDFQKLVPQSEFHPIPGAAHIPHYERPELVNPLLIEFLKR